MNSRLLVGALAAFSGVACGSDGGGATAAGGSGGSSPAGSWDACAMLLKSDVEAAVPGRLFADGMHGAGESPGSASLAAVSICGYTARGATAADTVTINLLARRAPNEATAPTLDSAKSGAMQIGATMITDVSGLGGAAFWDLAPTGGSRVSLQLNVFKGKLVWLIFGVSGLADTQTSLAAATKVAQASLPRVP